MTILISTDPNDPRYIPPVYTGERLDANYFCRGRNNKRLKWCKNRAGANTDHPGRGRCRKHDGTYKATHGLTSRYKSADPTIQTLLEEHAKDDRPLETLQEIQITRALFQKYLNEHAENPDPEIVLKFTSEITRMVERVFNMRAKMAITFEQLQRFLFVAGRQIEARVRAAVTDPKVADQVIAKIGKDLRAIRP